MFEKASQSCASLLKPGTNKMTQCEDMNTILHFATTQVFLASEITVNSKVSACPESRMRNVLLVLVLVPLPFHWLDETSENQTSLLLPLRRCVCGDVNLVLPTWRATVFAITKIDARIDEQEKRKDNPWILRGGPSWTRAVP